MINSLNYFASVDNTSVAGTKIAKISDLNLFLYFYITCLDGHHCFLGIENTYDKELTKVDGKAIKSFEHLRGC